MGDFVAIKQKFCNPYFYPTGIVTGTERNDIGETVVIIIRLSNKEVVRRHPCDVILLEKISNVPVEQSSIVEQDLFVSRPKRVAAMESNSKIKDLFNSGLI